MSRALDDIAPAFRAACERWPNAPNPQQHYRDLARTWLSEMERLAVEDWSRREPKPAAVHGMVKWFIRFAKIDAFDNAPVNSLVRWLSCEIESGSKDE